MFYCNSESCTTTEMSLILTSCLTAIKNHVQQYDKNLFWFIKNSGDFLNISFSTYGFCNLYTTELQLHQISSVFSSAAIY